MTRRAILETLAEEDLVAKPTRLGDTLFRSRLEARWSLALFALGIAWEYEPRGVLVDGRRRWPDFWLPREEVWLEIKPAHTPVELHLALSVAEATGSPLLWVAGPPRFGDYQVSLCDFGGLDVVSGLVFGIGRRDKSRVWVTAPDLSVSFALPVSRDGEGDVPRTRCSRLTEAYRAAMTWRF